MRVIPDFSCRVGRAPSGLGPRAEFVLREHPCTANISALLGHFQWWDFSCGRKSCCWQWPPDYMQGCPYTEGRAPSSSSSQGWLCVVPLTACPKPQEPPPLWRNTESNSSFHLSLFKGELTTLVAASSWLAVLSQSFPRFSCCRSETSPCPGHPLGGFHPVLLYAIFHHHKGFQNCKHPHLFFYSRSQETNLDPMFLGMYPYESNTNFREKGTPLPT